VFTDSIENNIETIKELFQAIPPSERGVARRSAALVEKTVMGIMKAYPNQPAAGLGMAFAIYTIAQRLVQAPKEGDSEKTGSGLIQLLS
jgi:hypothetical protein